MRQTMKDNKLSVLLVSTVTVNSVLTIQQASGSVLICTIGLHISKFTICCAYHSVLVLIFLYYIQITFNTVCVTSTVSNTCILTSTMASPSAVDTGDDAATCVVYNTCDGHDDKGSWYIITLNINYRLCQATSITSSHLNPKN